MDYAMPYRSNTLGSDLNSPRSSSVAHYLARKMAAMDGADPTHGILEFYTDKSRDAMEMVNRCSKCPLLYTMSRGGSSQTGALTLSGP